MRFLPKTLHGGLRVSGALIILGLLIEFVTLFWVHALSFMLFANASVVLIGAGILLYLVTLLRHAKHGDPPVA